LFLLLCNLFLNKLLIHIVFHYNLVHFSELFIVIVEIIFNQLFKLIEIRFILFFCAIYYYNSIVILRIFYFEYI